MAESSELTKLIRKSVGLSESVNKTARSDFSPLPTGTQIISVDRLPQMDIIHLQSRVDHYEAIISQLVARIDQLERAKVKEFQETDVYEVGKRMERLEQRISLLESDGRIIGLEFKKSISIWSIYASIAASIFASLLWWIWLIS